MDGFQNLPFQQDQRFWVYTGNKNNATSQTWLKPPGISFVHIITIGPGAGGSGAYPYAAGVAARGGSGGGGGSMNSVFLPTYLVPDILYINIGLGGTGGASSTSGTANAGTAGQDLTYVSFYPVKSVGYAVCIASPGGAGTVPAAGTGAIGGNGGATAGSTFFPNSQIGLRTYTPGQAGSAGGTTGGTSVTATYRVTGGGGGAGNTAANVVGAGGSISIIGGDTSLRTISPSPAGTNGIKFQDLIQFIMSGGPGASSSTTISGSDGGWGGYGSGGGGGSVGPGLGGAGGVGGDGLVIITCG